MKRSFHDLSVLFDDDDKVCVIWGYQEIHLAELDASLTDIVPGSERIIIHKGAGMGEGSHFYKFDGEYLITSAEWSGPFRMPAARARSPFGPYEVNRAISQGEDFGETQGFRLRGKNAGTLAVAPPDPKASGGLSMHQGGIIQTPKGEWWGWSMFEGNAVGRLTALSPITWQDGWPYFGLPGNLGRTPRTWVKPDLPGEAPHAPYQRSDSFDGPALNAIWQWNHVPVDGAWSLTERKGALRLTALSAPDFLQARDTLTQRAIGPQSTPTVELDARGLRPGDIAGLALLNRPYAWLGVRRDAGSLSLLQTDELGDVQARVALRTKHLWLRAAGDFTTDVARFSFSLDGRHFHDIGVPVTLPYQLLTFQGVRYSLFAYNTTDATGGHADFLSFGLNEGRPESRPAIPYGRTVRLSPVETVGTSSMIAAPFQVRDRSLGRVALVRGGKALTVAPDGQVSLQPMGGGPAQAFQWMESLSGGVVLMSLQTNRYLHVTQAGSLRADSPGPSANNADRSRFDVR